MGSCSSRSSTEGAVVTAAMTSNNSDRSYRYLGRSRGAVGLPSRRLPSPSPLVTYLSELDSSRDLESSVEFSSSRRPLWRPRLQEEEERRIEIEALQQSLAAMEDFFQSLLGQAQIYMEAMDPAGAGGSGPPPASESALRKLPLVAYDSSTTTSENRTCGICCEPHAVGDKVTLMPCGHVYHQPCIEAWLSRHCTCPVCRYEMATDDDAYEPGRLERMAVRKIPSDVSSDEVSGAVYVDEGNRSVSSA